MILRQRLDRKRGTGAASVLLRKQLARGDADDRHVSVIQNATLNPPLRRIIHCVANFFYYSVARIGDMPLDEIREFRRHLVRGLARALQAMVSKTTM